MRVNVTAILLALVIVACSKEEVAPASLPQADVAPATNLPLVVYATLPAARLQPVLDAYSVETGKKVQLVTGNADFSAAFSDSPGSPAEADLLLARGLAELWQLAERDGFRPTYSESIATNIPQIFRDEESRWTALGTSARIVVYNRELVDTDSLADVDGYESLGDEQWQGRLCLSSSRLPGNRALVAFLISRHAVRDAEIVVRNWRANLASSVFADESGLLNAISDGQCAIGIVGSNALATYLSADAGSPVVPHRFADASSTMVDASGGGVARHAHNPAGAAELLGWLTTKVPNSLYAAQHREFPANTSATLSRSVEPWGDMVSSPTSLSALGFLHEDAVLLVERARYP